MNKELIQKLTERARLAADKAYCPYTNTPVGCALLVDDLIFVGCNIENADLGASADAGTIAIQKSISEGHTDIRAICFWCKSLLPYPSGRVRQLLHEFCADVSIVVANDDTFKVLNLEDIFPLPPQTVEAE